MFELFDIKQNHVIEFGEFVRSLSVFHPKAPMEDKARCGCRRVAATCSGARVKDEVWKRGNATARDWPPTQSALPATPYAPPVAFRIYDIKQNGVIERSELKRFLVALMADNPDVDLDEQVRALRMRRRRICTVGRAAD